jgi:phospholipase/carboxylesterase
MRAARSFALGGHGKSSYGLAMSTTELAGLRIHAVGGAAPAAPRALVILLHGFGAPGDDLVQLAVDIAAPRGTQFLFPEAPIDLAEVSPEMAGARAWWPIDVMRVQIAMMSGRSEELAEYLRPGMAPAVALVKELVVEARRQYEVGFERIVLGGFSQGAIVALEATLEAQRPLAGLLLFSGACLDTATLVPRAQPLAPMPIVISHGQADPILPYSLGERVAKELVRAGWNVEWVPFLGGHGIPPKATSAAGRLVSTQLV